MVGGGDGGWGRVWVGEMVGGWVGGVGCGARLCGRRLGLGLGLGRLGLQQLRLLGRPRLLQPTAHYHLGLHLRRRWHAPAARLGRPRRRRLRRLGRPCRRRGRRPRRPRRRRARRLSRLGLLQPTAHDSLGLLLLQPSPHCDTLSAGYHPICLGLLLLLQPSPRRVAALQLPPAAARPPSPQSARQRRPLWPRRRAGQPRPRRVGPDTSSGSSSSGDSSSSSGSGGSGGSSSLSLAAAALHGGSSVQRAAVRHLLITPSV